MTGLAGSRVKRSVSGTARGAADWREWRRRLLLWRSAAHMTVFLFRVGIPSHSSGVSHPSHQCAAQPVPESSGLAAGTVVCMPIALEQQVVHGGNAYMGGPEIVCPVLDTPIWLSYT
jgi:hypothetical protein